MRLAASPASGVQRLAHAAQCAWVLEPEGTARHWAVQQGRAAGFEPDGRFELARPLTPRRFVSPRWLDDQGTALAPSGVMVGISRRPAASEPA